jgi:hypothetical protein
MLAALVAALVLVVPAAEAQLADNAPADQPLGLDRQGMEELQARIRPLVAEARRTYPAARDRYLRGLPEGHTFFVTTQLSDEQGRAEQIFVQVQSIEGTRIAGSIASEIQLIEGYAHGDRYEFDEDEVVDWLIARPDGTEEGNIIGKFLDDYQRELANGQ